MPDHMKNPSKQDPRSQPDNKPEKEDGLEYTVGNPGNDRDPRLPDKGNKADQAEEIDLDELEDDGDFEDDDEDAASQ